MQKKDILPLISIIIPIYNVEKYLTRCIKSIINQTYTNLEIILVNDGSTDNSGEICDEYQIKDKRIKTVHKINGGLSDARNVGIDNACGDYISFVDSDDWVTKNYIENMYSLMIENNCDIAVCRMRKMLREGYIDDVEMESYKIYLKDEAVKQLLYQRIATSVCGKLYRADLWDDIRFPMGKLYEDVESLYLIFNQCKKVVITNKSNYLYFYRPESIVNQKFSNKKMDYVENCQKVFVHVKNDYPQFENAVISRLMWAEIHVLMHMDDPKEYSKEYKMLMSDIKRYRWIVLKDKENQLKIRAVAALSFMGYGTLKIVFKMQMAKRRFIG